MAETHEVLLATVEDFAHRSGALRVAVLLDLGEGLEPPLLEWEAEAGLTLSQGEAAYAVPPSMTAGAEPIHVHAPKAVPAGALDVDPTLGEVAAPIGLMDALVDAVTGLARVMGGRSVAVADFATRSGEPLSVAARVGEPAVLAVGEHEFQVGRPPA